MVEMHIDPNISNLLLDNESASSLTSDDGHTFGRTFSFWINGVLTMCLIVVGVVGNVAIVTSLACNTKKWLALYYYFMAFAIWNTALLVSTVFVYSMPALRPDESEVSMKGYDDFINLSLIGYPMANCGMTAAIWLVLSLTVERYVAVVKPFHLISSTPKRRARYVVAAISILAPLYNIPLFFELEVVRAPGGEVVDVKKTDLRDHPLYKIAYRIVGNAAFLSIVPLLSIVIMSIRIVYVVRTLTNEDRYNSFSENDQEYNLMDPNVPTYTVDRRRSSLSRCHSKMLKHNTHRTHLTLAALAAKFVLCYTLPTLLNILEIAVEPSTLTQCGMAFLVDVSNFMVVCDSAMNGFLYFSWRRKLALYYRKQQAPVVFAKLPPPGSGSIAASMQTHLSPVGMSERRNSSRRNTMESSRRNSARSTCSFHERVSAL